MYKESYEVMLKRYELDIDNLVLKKHQLMIKPGNFDLQIEKINHEIEEDKKCIAWVAEQIKQGKIRPNA